MAQVRVISYGQEKWYHDVIGMRADDLNYLVIDLAAHPTRVFYYLPTTAVLYAATPEDVVTQLREETYARTTQDARPGGAAK